MNTQLKSSANNIQKYLTNALSGVHASNIAKALNWQEFHRSFAQKSHYLRKHVKNLFSFFYHSNDNKNSGVFSDETKIEPLGHKQHCYTLGKRNTLKDVKIDHRISKVNTILSDWFRVADTEKLPSGKWIRFDNSFLKSFIVCYPA